MQDVEFTVVKRIVSEYNGVGIYLEDGMLILTKMVDTGYGNQFDREEMEVEIAVPIVVVEGVLKALED